MTKNTKEPGMQGTRNLMAALAAAVAALTMVPGTAALEIGDPYLPTTDDLHHKDAPEHVANCAEEWSLLETLGNGATATFFIWVEHQTLQQVLEKNTIDMLVTWNHQHAAHHNTYQINYRSTAWEPLRTMFGLQIPERVAGYADLWTAAGCAGLQFDTGAAHLGNGGEVSIEIVYEDVVRTYTSTNTVTVGSTNSWEDSLESAVSSKITAKLNGDIGGEVSGEIRTRRSMGAAESHFHEEGTIVSFTPTSWAGVFGAHVGGGGLMGWLDEETGGIGPGGDPTPPIYATTPVQNEAEEALDSCPSPPEDCAIL